MSKVRKIFVFVFLLASLAWGDSPQVTASSIGKGVSQRSVVAQVALTFDQSVEARLVPSSITLTNLNTQAEIATAVAYDAGTDVATLTFPNETGGVLPNGNYRLIVSGLEVANEFGELLDGDGDGIGGDDYEISTFRYFADFDGDRDVDFQDTGRFRAAYPSVAGDANYRFDADNDADGDIDAVDLEAFRNTYLTTLSGLSETPNILNPPTITGEQEVTLTGTTSASSTVVVSNGDQAYQVFSDETGSFSITIPLFSNRINYLFARGDSFGGDLSSLTPLTITQDSQPPFLFVDIPMDGAEVSSEFITVTGRVGDTLGGFEGLTVTSNGEAATIIPGVGSNGTFEKKDIPLQLGSNTISIVAADSLGNSITKNVTVNRLASPQIQIVAGNDQHAERNSELSQPVVVKLTDVGDRPFADKIVTFKVARSDGRLSTSQGVTADSEEMMVQVRSDAQGMARVYWRVGSDAGQSNNQLRVTSAGLRGAALFTASATCRPASQINVGTGGNQIGEAGAQAPQPLTAWVSDDLNGVPMTPVTFTVVSGDGSLDGQQSVTVSTGVTGHASTILTLGESGGEVRVEADFPSNAGRSAVFVARGLVRDPTQPTSFSGVVLDNSNLPIGGASVSLTTNGLSYGPIASNTDGVFTFTEVTAGAGFLDVDGTNATSLNGQNLTESLRYPKLHYQVTVVPNAKNSLPTTVLLPTLNPANERGYDGSQDVELTIEGIAGLKMLVKAGSMTLADGTIPDAENPVVMSLNQVHSDNIPMPIQDGVAPLLTWTLQPGGAHFDPPVQVTYPNMSCLPPGAATNLLSYNHDTERFEVVAAATVVEDGSVIQSDPGSGITISGWGCNCPPYSATGECEGPFSLDIADNSTGEEQRYEGNPEDGEEPYSYSWKVGSVEISTEKTLTIPQPDYDFNAVVVDTELTVTDANGVSRTQTEGVLLNLGLGTDWDRNGVIESYDYEQTDPLKEDKVFRFWVNDDADVDSVSDDALDDLPGRNINNIDFVVNGERDLVDFFPVGVFVGETSKILPIDRFDYQIRHSQDGLNFFFSDFLSNRVGAIHSERVESGCGISFGSEAASVNVETIFSEGLSIAKRSISSSFEEPIPFGFQLNERGQGIIFCEGRRRNNRPLDLVVLDDSGNEVAKTSLKLDLGDVKEMYRVLNVRTSDSKFITNEGPQSTSLTNPSRYPDYFYNRIGEEERTLINIHGLDWSGEESPAGHSEIFKRFFQLGSNARFVGVSWYSDQNSPVGYYNNVSNAFISAFHSSQQIAPFLGEETSVFAHSLGNVFACSMLNDFGLDAQNYFMVNAALARESLVPENISCDVAWDQAMKHPEWRKYTKDGNERLLASGWHLLFSDEDPRSDVKWKSRFSNIVENSSTNIVNFFSSGEDILKPPPADGEIPALIGFGGGLLNLSFFDLTQDHIWIYAQMTKGLTPLGADPSSISSILDVCDGPCNNMQAGWQFGLDRNNYEPISDSDYNEAANSIEQQLVNYLFNPLAGSVAGAALQWPFATAEPVQTRLEGVFPFEILVARENANFNFTNARLTEDSLLALDEEELIEHPLFRPFSTNNEGGAFELWEDGSWLYSSDASVAIERLPLLNGDLNTSDLIKFKNHARLLAEGIPAMSFPAGSTPLDVSSGAENINLQVEAFSDTWPLDDDRSWRHGHYKEVSLVGVHELYEECVRRIKE